MAGSLRVALAAGAIGGFAGGVLFALAHFAIVAWVPILVVLAPVLGALIGVTFGLAWRVARRPSGAALRGPAVVALAWAAALPAWGLAVSRALAGAPNAVALDAPTIAAHVSGFPIGAAFGAILARSAKGAAALALAGGAVTLAGARQILVGGGSMRGIAFFLALALVAALAGLAMERAGERFSR